MNYVYVIHYCKHYEYVGVSSVHATEQGALSAAIALGTKEKLFYDYKIEGITNFVEMRQALQPGTDLTIEKMKVQDP